MHRRLVRACSFVASVVIVFAVVGCQNMGGGNEETGATGGPGGNAEKEVSALVDQYTEALLKKDAAALDRIWADDLTFINLRGELLTKQNRMDNVKTGATAFKSIQVSDKRIRVYGGQTAVLTCRVALEAQYSGQEGSGSYGVTMVWVKPKGMWQMVAVQMTRVG